ncbi:MAG TPA: ORF6N domain-containing protein, partial [Pirellulales bacterium]
MTSPYVQETVQIHNSVLKNLHHSGIPLLSYKANAPWHLTIAVRWDNVAREMRRQSKAKGPAVHLPAERIAQRIIIVRGHKVLLDFDLAAIYGVETRTLVQAVKRNAARFPLDFMFQLTVQELASWRSQFVISNVG